MRVFVKTKPSAKEDGVVPPEARLIEDPTSHEAPRDKRDWYKVSVREPAVEGRATEAVAKLLALHFKVSRSQVKLVSGATSKRKVFEIFR